MDLSRETPLTLRPWRSTDAPAVLDAFSTADMAHQAAAMAGLEDAVNWLEGAGSMTSRETGFGFAVTGPDDVPVGNVAATAIDSHDTAWASYWTAARARGNRVASDALTALAAWSHDRNGVFRLELGHRVNNPPSCRVAVNAGFIAEGVERAKLCYAGRRYDVERHARLASDGRGRLHRRVTIRPTE